MLTYLRRFTLLTVALCVVAHRAIGQETAKPVANKADYSREPFVVEEDLTKIVFENDGTSTRESAARVRIQSDAGVQQFGVLAFSYQGANEAIDVGYVRVRKPDGTVVVTPPENIQDMPSDITRQAPFYSDLQEKHVAVRGLSTGDLLEYRMQWRMTKPLAPGNFWFAYNFPHDSINLHSELLVSIPGGRRIKWKSPDSKPDIADQGGRQVFRWTSTQLRHRPAEDKKGDQEDKLYRTARGKLPPPNVQISSFENWEAIGAWYSRLQEERAKPSPEIRAKAAELTKDAKDDDAKLHAIYNYVSTRFHYIGVAFGVGRYQPHLAADVLANQYGDCKDKHTLLASLLDAVGIRAYPALINSGHDIDLDVPSPAQFDHVITAVPRGKDFIWLDTTAEVAPFGYLLSPLLDKPVLVMPSGQSAWLARTPANAASPGIQTFKIEAKLNDNGRLEGTVQRTVTGDDSEIRLRSAFRSWPLNQWKQLVQQVSEASGFAGDVSEVTASSPERTDEPFRFSYTYTREDYPDWADHQIRSPLPPMLLQTPDTKPEHPILLGAPQELHYESRVQLPAGYTPDLPVNLDLMEDFAEYHVRYSARDGSMTSDRRLVVKLREVPLSEVDAFKKFSKAVLEDDNVYIALSPVGTPEDAMVNALAKLPRSQNAEATSACGQGINLVQKGDMTTAIGRFQRAVEVDPHFVFCWFALAEAYKEMGESDKAFETMQKANQVNPRQPIIYKELVSGLMDRHQSEEALSILRDVMSVEPKNDEVLSLLGNTLTTMKRYTEAAAAFESAIKIRPDRAGVYVQLGIVYMRAESLGKELAAFKKAVELDPSPSTLNDIAYQTADANQQLPLALQYAEQAVHVEEEASSKIKLSNLTQEDLNYAPRLAEYWDTLGWVHFHLGNYDTAETYTNAAWMLLQDPVTADHLGQIYEQQSKKKAAIQMYRSALAVSNAPPGKSDNLLKTRARLERLSPGGSSSKNLYSSASELGTIRTTRLPVITKETAIAEFFVLLSPRPRPVEAKFVSGAEGLKASEKVLASTDLHPLFPDTGPTRLLRRGILSCYPITGCTFVLYLPYDVQSVN